SIGLFAFNEAIFKYTPERGSSFLSFANLVVKRKVIDYIRQLKQYPKTESFNEQFGEEQMENPLEIAAVRERYRKEQDALLLRDELKDFQLKLKPFKISLSALTKVAPKHKDSRESAIQNAQILYDDPELYSYVCKKKKLPLQGLSKKVTVSKKTLERNRKFILAVFIVLKENYLFLKDYLQKTDTPSKKNGSRKPVTPIYCSLTDSRAATTSIRRKPKIVGGRSAAPLVEMQATFGL